MKGLSFGSFITKAIKCLSLIAICPVSVGRAVPMRRMFKILLLAMATVLMASVGVQADHIYQLDNNFVLYPLNASDGTEPHDNWFGNVFTAQAGANLITQVDFGVFTTTPGSSGSVVLYDVTASGGSPPLGATRVYTQSFTPLTGDGQNVFLQQINLTNPVLFDPGHLFLVSIFIPNVIALPPNDVYPYLLDLSGNPTGSWRDRSDPNAFNLDDLSTARPVVVPFVPGGFAADPGHIIIRAVGTEATQPIPEPTTVLLLGAGLAGIGLMRRRFKS
jgi:hypothetical protein